MRILVTNDDGIFAPGLWALVRELKNIAQVVVVAPDREQSAIGTAVTLHRPLRARKVTSIVTEVDTYSVEGTPTDSVILALGQLVRDKIDLVISGINRGLNLGADVFISGTVGAALQGYLRGYPAIAISADAVNHCQLSNAAKFATLVAKRVDCGTLPADIFLNINLPRLSLARIKGAKITRLANESHTSSVDERDDGTGRCYWLVRNRINNNANKKTDVWAIEQGNISITPLHTSLSSKPLSPIRARLFSDLLYQLRKCYVIGIE